MSDIIEYMPSITDTPEEIAEMIKAAQEAARATSEPDDFMVFPPEQEEKIEESSDTLSIDGKVKEFKYLSSYKKGSDLISFGQDGLGFWWYFIRTSFNGGKGLKGPFRRKELMLADMEK